MAPQTSILAPTPASQAQCAIVGRAFQLGERRVAMGEQLTRDQLMAMPSANYRALVENRFIRVLPIVSGIIPLPTQNPSPRSQSSGERHSFMTGFGKYTVIEGTVLGTKLTKADAEALVKSVAAKQASVVSAALGAGPPAPTPPTAAQKKAVQRAAAKAKAAKAAEAEKAIAAEAAAQGESAVDDDKPLPETQDGANE